MVQGSGAEGKAQAKRKTAKEISACFCVSGMLPQGLGIHPHLKAVRSNLSLAISKGSGGSGYLH